MPIHFSSLRNAIALGCTLALGCFQGCGDTDIGAVSAVVTANPAGSPLEIVNERMGAYNRHDIEAFLATYADDVRVFTYPDQELGGGKAHMRSIFEPMFAAGDVQVVIHHQIAKDRYVVNHETVSEAGQDTEYVSIYEVKEGLIRSVRFVRD